MSSGCCVESVKVLILGATMKSQSESYDGWAYGEGEEEKWGNCYGYCRMSMQSPIRIWVKEAAVSKMPPLSGTLIEDRDTPFRFNITNDNYTVMVKLVDDGKLYLKGGPLKGRYKLDHFIFSWGSTDDRGSGHTNGNKSSAMEVQLRLYNEDYEDYDDAVSSTDYSALTIGVLMNVVEEDNPSLAPIVSALPSVRRPGQSAFPKEPMVYGGLLADPVDDFFAYNGSETEPPCYRKVVWLVYLFGKGVSESQLAAFRELQSTAGPMVNNYRRAREYDRGPVLVSDKHSACSGGGGKCSWEKRRGAAGGRRLASRRHRRGRRH